MVGVQSGQAIDASPIAFDEADVRLIGRLRVMRVEHRSFVDEVVVEHRISAGIGDTLDINYTRTPGFNAASRMSPR